MNILIPILLGITWIISLITMALALSLDDQISSLHLDINRVAFFKIYNIYTSQLPDLQVSNIFYYYQGIVLCIIVHTFCI